MIYRNSLKVFLLYIKSSNKANLEFVSFNHFFI